jgi:CubicO group peptidase (beta-lactamase class C family)
MTSQTLDDVLSRHGITHCRVLVHDELVYTAGPQDEPLPIHSIRKSIISALFGQLIGDGLVRLDSTLADLGVDDSPQLTPMEKSATLEHVLTSSSGCVPAPGIRDVVPRVHQRARELARS